MPETTKCEAKESCSDGDKSKCAESKCKKADAPPAPTTEQKKLKPCCACPETKRPRDQCIVEFGEENCTELIEAHKQCMRKMGFNI